MLNSESSEVFNQGHIKVGQIKRNHPSKTSHVMEVPNQSRNIGQPSPRDRPAEQDQVIEKRNAAIGTQRSTIERTESVGGYTYSTLKHQIVTPKYRKTTDKQGLAASIWQVSQSYKRDQQQRTQVKHVVRGEQTPDLIHKTAPDLTDEGALQANYQKFIDHLTQTSQKDDISSITLNATHVSRFPGLENKDKLASAGDSQVHITNESRFSQRKASEPFRTRNLVMPFVVPEALKYEAKMQVSPYFTPRLDMPTLVRKKKTVEPVWPVHPKKVEPVETITERLVRKRSSLQPLHSHGSNSFGSQADLTWRNPTLKAYQIRNKLFNQTFLNDDDLVAECNLSTRVDQSILTT